MATYEAPVGRPGADVAGWTASTAGVADVIGWADRIGSIEPGKLADFVVPDRDVLTCPVDEIREARVLTTVLGGETVHEG
ncbi:amidohydrolase family protein [Pseudonocardia sp. DLS-67]